MKYPLENVSTPPSISELCTLLVFLLDVIPLVRLSLSNLMHFMGKSFKHSKFNPLNSPLTIPPFFQELYSEVQTQYLPQMLCYMVQSLLENMELLGLPELTHALKTCFKVLSKVQMPPSYLDIETGSGNGVGAFQPFRDG